MHSIDVVKLTSDLVNIRSQSEYDGEAGVAKYITEYLDDLGIVSETTEFSKGRCSVTASIGKGEGLMLNGHIDTVPIGDERKWKYGTEAKAVNGKLYGRGTSDMKGGVAAILASLPSISKSHLRRRLLLTFVADEEVSSRGSEWLIKNRPMLFNRVRYGIVAEPTDMNVQVAQKGHVVVDVTAKGLSAHGSKPELGHNAIVDMSKFIMSLGRLKFKTRDRVLGKGTVNVGRISGGTAVNIVPDLCEISIDRRLVPGETDTIASSQIKSILNSLGISYEIKTRGYRKPFALKPDSYIVRLLRSIVSSNLTGSTGYTEAELYNAKAGIECVVFGPGTKNIIHKPDEYVSILNLEKSKKYFSMVMQKWCI